MTLYLVDTNIISEIRRKSKANKGVRAFFKEVANEYAPVFISVITAGELRRGVDLIRHRGDLRQADQLERWLAAKLEVYRDNVLDITPDIAQLWGRLRVPHPENALDKFIAATALIYDLTVVTRNRKNFVRTGVKLLDPFKA